MKCGSSPPKPQSLKYYIKLFSIHRKPTKKKRKSDVSHGANCTKLQIDMVKIVAYALVIIIITVMMTKFSINTEINMRLFGENAEK
ncbi:hypothetical protein H5410_030209 [Solanum commersonii]|uniref:Transmembrane protein n=1 Tax=Solanum commersonii TaxID=4109 RepID=A0A9J5YG74_SOLCO|nr:hypothetical protein H5410_030209 [Solanum commersonii]